MEPMSGNSGRIGRFREPNIEFGVYRLLSSKNGEILMPHLKRALWTAAIAVLAGMGAMVATTGVASAHVVCNADGDCWHTDQTYHYGPDAKVEVHPDSWYFRQDWTGKDRRYHEHHDDRGYYKGGVWIKF